jgi:hypothetical protein
MRAARRLELHSPVLEYRSLTERQDHDWVVIYYERGGEQHQSTVVTAERANWRANE